MSVQSLKVGNVFSKELAKEWEKKGNHIKEVQGCDNPMMKELEFELGNGKEILEIGCGSGKLLEHIAAHYDRCRIVGLDISKDMIEAAKAKIDRLGNHNNIVQYIVGDIEDGIFRQASFDVIILKQVLHHLHDPVFVLRKIREYLKPEGIVILMVPGGQYQSEIFPFHENGKDVLGRFSLDGLEEVLSEGGLFPYRIWKERFIFKFANFYDYITFMKDIGGLQKLFDYNQEKYSEAFALLKLYEKMLVFTRNFDVSGEYVVAICQRREVWGKYSSLIERREDAYHDSEVLHETGLQSVQ
mgnify:CR=1 FL=1|jgi:SAM-dependent methyltransferase